MITRGKWQIKGNRPDRVCSAFERLNGLLAQLVEQGTLNAWVGGSSPSQPTYERKRAEVVSPSPSNPNN